MPVTEDSSGRLNSDPKTPAKSELSISFPTGSATTGDQQKDGALPGSDWFAVDKYPHAHFVATSVKANGPVPMGPRAR